MFEAVALATSRLTAIFVPSAGRHSKSPADQRSAADLYLGHVSRVCLSRIIAILNPQPF